MKRRVRPESTQKEHRRRESPIAEQKLESATGGIRAHIIGGGFDDPVDPDSAT